MSGTDARELLLETINQYVEAGASAICPGGTVFLLRVAQSDVDVVFYRNGRRMGAANGVRQGFGYEAPQAFDSVIITTTDAQQIIADIANGHMLANNVHGNVESTRVQATGITDPAVFDVGTAPVQVAVGQSGIRQIVITNIGATTIYLGGSGVTNQSPIILAAGATWRDADAAQANWWALSSAAGGIVSVVTMS